MMLKEEKIGRSEHSDESRSTEHDATVSLSEHDDFNEIHSVFSDTASIASKSSRLNDAKRLAHKLNKLKEENAFLREALAKANAIDITTLRTKLRGANADLVRVKQINSELRDRVQHLERKLFDALNSSKTSSPALNISARLQQKSAQIKHLAGAVNTTNDLLEKEYSVDQVSTDIAIELQQLRESIKTWQMKYNGSVKQCRHFQQTIAIMQVNSLNWSQRNFYLLGI